MPLRPWSSKKEEDEWGVFLGGGGGDEMLGEERARSLYKGATEAVWSMFATLFRTSLDLKSRVV